MEAEEALSTGKMGGERMGKREVVSKEGWVGVEWREGG